MTKFIMPAFVRRPIEANHIGNMLAGYGELEYELATCLSMVLDDDNTAFRVFFRLNSESQRIEVTDAILKPAYLNIGLADQYNETLGAVRYCKTLRNQYAHCHWTEYAKEGLFFGDMDRAAKRATGSLYLKFYHVDVPLLQQQEEYFLYAYEWLWFLSNEFPERKDVLQMPPHEAPKIIPKPSQYNPPEEHPHPLQLTADEPPPPAGPLGS